MSEAPIDVNAASEPFGIAPAAVCAAAEVMLLDVRRTAAYSATRQMLPGAVWRNPEHLTQCLPELADLSAGRALIVYCVFGHEVSRGAVLKLRAAGIEAHFLRGGIDAWQRAGLPLVDKPAG